MKQEEFCEILGGVNEAYVQQAREPGKAKLPAWLPWSAAACFVAAVAAVVAVVPNYGNHFGVVPPDSQSGMAEGNFQGDASSTAGILPVYMETIMVNEVTGFLDAARVWRDPERYEAALWDPSAIRAYYGKELTPPYVPEGLSASPGNGTAQAILRKEDGAVVEDTVWLGFYHAYYEDGSPQLTEGIAARKGFSITASRVGLLGDCIYLLPENERATSAIGGVAVTFGYRSMPYGPYDPETHAPAGYYDMYVAEWEQEGVEYQLVADQMELEDVVKVVASMIYGQEEILIVQG